MAAPEEYHNLEEAASTALHLRAKYGDNDNAGERRSIDMPVMVAMVSNKTVEHPGQERKTCPMSCNHPLLFCSPEKVREVSKLVPLTDPSSSRPLLRCSTSRHTESYADPDGVFRPVVLGHDGYEIAESLADDAMSGHDDDLDYLKSEVNHLDITDPDQADEKYTILRRGRAYYRENASPYDSDCPVAENIHRRSQHGRSHSLPPHYDTTLMSYDHDPFHGRIQDKKEHKAALIEEFRETSEHHLVHPAPLDLAFKSYGSGEATFSQKDVLVECYVFAYQRQHRVDGNGNKVDMLDKKNVKMIHDFLKHSKHLDVTAALIKEVIFAEQTVVSAGAIYFSEAAVQADKAKVKGAFREQNLHDLMAAQAKKAGKQDEATSVFLKVHNDPHVKRCGRLHIEQNYIDPDKPGQPVYNVQININDRNARRELYEHVRNQPDPPFSQDAIALFDVTHPAFRTRLEHLYQHVLKDDKNYFVHLQSTLRKDAKLWLLSVPYNNAQWSSNLFSTATNRPALLTAFEAAVANKPQIFILFRASAGDATALRNTMAQDFAGQVHYNPLPNKLLVDPIDGNSFTSKSFLPIAKIPGVHLQAEKSFQDWSDYELRISAGAHFEAFSSTTNARNEYSGTCVLLPVAQSYNPANKVFMVYAGAMTLDKASQKNAAPQKGARLVVWIDAESSEVDIPWSATVWTHFNWAGVDKVCFFASRPYENGEILDLHPVHSIDPGMVDKWTLPQLQRHAIKVKTNKITAEAATDYKELERRFKAISGMRIPYLMSYTDPDRAASLENSQQMFKGNAPKELPTGGIYDTVEPCAATAQYIQQGLEPDQLVVLERLADGGMRNKSTFVTGVSGSGKSRLMRTTQLPFLGKIRTSNIRNVHRNVDLQNLQFGERDEQDQLPMEFTEDPEFKKPELPEPTTLRPSFVQPTDKDYEPNGTIIEKGRSLYVAATNDTADSLYKAVHRTVVDYSVAMKRGTPLVQGLLHPNFEAGPCIPRAFNENIQVADGGNNASIRDQYVKCSQGSEYRAIRDARFRDWRSSMAFHAYNLCLLDHEQDPSILSAFTETERDLIREILESFGTTRAELKANGGVWSNDFSQRVEAACNTAFDWLDFKADIIVTTTSAATDYRFALHRQPHFIGIEEVGRIDDAMLLTFWSLYYSAHARVCVGDWRQIGVQLFSDKKDNPCYDQTKYNLLCRSMDNGIDTPDFKITHRFGNEELVELVRIINQDTSIKAHEDAARDDESMEIRRVHASLFPGLAVSTSAVYLNVLGSEKAVDVGPGGSIVNACTATVSANMVHKLVKEGVKGKDIVLTSPYRGQTLAHETRLATLVKDAAPELSAQLAKVRCSTIDAFMGEECLYHMHDSASRTGHVYKLPARAVVLYSRARVGFMLIGSTSALLNPNDTYGYDHACKEVLRHLIHTRRCVDLTPA